MCGIVGQINLGSTDIVSVEKLKLMTDAIAHRGPDGEGHWIDEDSWVGLGHRRLSILDLSSAGSQPMHYLDRYSIVFNGELYNYLELKRNLEQLGYKFSTHSDTEVLLVLFHHKGEKCLEDLDGMFAFAIYDKISKTIFAARDRFGEKPFFYCVHDGFFYFASEIKAFWAIGIPKEADLETTFYYMYYGRVHHPLDNKRTFFKQITKLQAAHYIRIRKDSLNSIHQHRYWKLPPFNSNEQEFDLKSVENKFFQLFSDSITRRLRSDVPVGSSLSGGLDSSTIVCMINHFNSNINIHQNTFSACFPGFAKDETKFMNKVINSTKSIGFFTFPDQQGFDDSFDKLCHFQDEPFGSASIYAQYEVMRLAKENGVTVLLDGQGADESLAGYSRYLETFTIENNLANGKSLSNISKQDIFNYLKKTLPGLYNIYRRRSQINNLKSKGFNEHYIEMAIKLPVPDEVHTRLFAHLNHDLCGGNLEDLLRYADRNSMAHGREVRLPFLDRELVEFIMSLPNSYKIRDGWTKWIQRVTFQSILPKEITWRTDKIGYEPPQKEWMKSAKIQERIMESKRTLYKQGIITKKESERRTDGADANEINDNSWYYLIAANLFSNN